MQKAQMKSMLQGTAVLTIASFVAKILSAIYRIPLQNLVGDEGFYVYQQVYPIYGIAMTLSLTGFPQFVSKLVAEQTGIEQKRSMLAQIFPWLMSFSVVLWSLVYFGRFVFAQWMGNLALAPLIQVVSFTFLLMPMLSVYRGFFQGEFQLYPSALSQVLEQFVRVGVILLAAWSFHWWSLTVYQVGVLAMGGAFLGGLVAWLYLWSYDRKGVRIFDFRSRKLVKEKYPSLARRLLLEGSFVSLYSGYLILFQLFDAFFITNALQKAHIPALETYAMKGIYDRGQPFVQLGLVVATALSASFLPMLTQQRVLQQEHLFRRSAKVYLRLSTGLGMAASLGLITLLPYLNVALFKTNDGQITLQIFACAIACMSMIQAYQSIAQSKNQFRFAFFAAAMGLAVKAVTTSGFTYFWSTTGASLSTILGLLTTLLLLMHHERTGDTRFLCERAFGWRLLAAIGVLMLTMGLFRIVVYSILGEVTSRKMAFTLSLVGVCIGVVSFVLGARWFKVLTTREWLCLPYGEKILRLGVKKK